MKKIIFCLPLILALSGCFNVPNNSNEPLSEDEESESGLLPNESEEETSESESNSESRNSLEVNSSYFPGPVGSGYPADQEIDVEGYKFDISYCLGTTSNAKFGDSIQMKKRDGYFTNKTALQGTITVVININIVSNTGQDLTECPTIYAASTLEGVGSANALNKPTGTDDSEGEFRTFIFTPSNDLHYFKVKDDSSNAIYIKTITWNW